MCNDSYPKSIVIICGWRMGGTLQARERSALVPNGSSCQPIWFCSLSFSCQNPTTTTHILTDSYDKPKRRRRWHSDREQLGRSKATQVQAFETQGSWVHCCKLTWHSSYDIRWLFSIHFRNTRVHNPLWIKPTVEYKCFSKRKGE